MCEPGYRLSKTGTCIEDYTNLDSCSFSSKLDSRRGTCAWCDDNSYQDQYSNCRSDKDTADFYEKLEYKFFISVVTDVTADVVVPVPP